MVYILYHLCRLFTDFRAKIICFISFPPNLSILLVNAGHWKWVSFFSYVETLSFKKSWKKITSGPLFEEGGLGGLVKWTDGPLFYTFFYTFPNHKGSGTPIALKTVPLILLFRRTEKAL